MLVDKTDANTGRMRLARNLDKLQRRWHMRRRMVSQREKQRMQQLNAKKTYTATPKALRCNDWRRHQDQNSWPQTLGDHFQPTWRRDDDERLSKMMWVRNTIVNALPFAKLESLLELCHVLSMNSVPVSGKVVHLNENVSLRS